MLDVVVNFGKECIMNPTTLSSRTWYVIFEYMVYIMQWLEHHISSLMAKLVILFSPECWRHSRRLWTNRLQGSKKPSFEMLSG